MKIKYPKHILALYKAWGSKGGKSKSPAKIAASKKNAIRKKVVAK